MYIHDPEDPRLLRIHAKRLIKRDVDQLLGICEFALQDGHVDHDEAEAIFAWLRTHRACLDTWPANILYDRLRAMLADNVLDIDEQGELLGLIASIARPPAEDGTRLASTLPLNIPAPTLQFADRSFCFTGVFEFGTRADCHEAVERQGGMPAKGITKKLHYLVIGNIGSEAWRHTSFGTKIAKAVEYREAGVPIAIISETHWTQHLQR